MLKIDLKIPGRNSQDLMYDTYSRKSAVCTTSPMAAHWTDQSIASSMSVESGDSVVFVEICAGVQCRLHTHQLLNLADASSCIRLGSQILKQAELKVQITNSAHIFSIFDRVARVDIVK